MFCGKSYLYAIGESIPYIGSLVGLLVFMVIGDRYGRRPALGISLAVCAVGAILLVAFKSIYTVYLGMLLIGIGITPAGYLELVILNEVSTGHFRTFSMCFMYVAFALGEMAIWPFSASVSSDWRLFGIFYTTIPFVAACGLYLVTLETPKFLVSSDTQKTAAVLNRMAQFNGVEDEIREN